MRRFVGRGRLAPAVVSMCVVALVASSSPALAAQNLITGFADAAYKSLSETDREAAFETSVAEGAGIARVDVSWRAVAGASKPANPADPADPSYDFSGIDAAARGAAAHGLDVVFTVYSAPDWAEGPNRPPVNDDALPGTWKPDPGQLRDFAQALATRYSGSFVPASGGGALPQIHNFEVWNEENLWVYLTPQYDGKKLVVVDHYRKMLNAFYAGVKSVSKKSVVVVGGNAPYGDPAGGNRTRPLLFLKELFCLSDKLKPLSCPDPAKFDVLGVHPINLSGGPTLSAIDDDDASSADVPNAVEILRAAEKSHTVASGARHDIWATEFWWESFPDSGAKAIPGLNKHAIWVEQAMYLFWKAGVDVAINLQINDTPASGDDELNSSFQAGVFLADGTPKPAATSFRFPFVLERRSKDKVFAWGKAPAGGKLTIEEKASGGWRKVASVNAKQGKVFTTTLKARGKGKYRARVGGETSLAWTQK